LESCAKNSSKDFLIVSKMLSECSRESVNSKIEAVSSAPKDWLLQRLVIAKIGWCKDWLV